MPQLLSRDIVANVLWLVSVASLALLVGMIVLRGVRRIHTHRMQLLDTRVRPLVLSLALAEAEELPELLEIVTTLNRAQQQRASYLATHMLAEFNGEARHNLAEMLTELGETARQVQATTSRNRISRAKAAEYLGLVTMAGRLPLLKRLSQDPQREVRLVALRALGREGSEESAAWLVEMLRSPHLAPPSLVGAAVLSMHVPQPQGLQEALIHPDAGVRQTAVIICGVISSAETTAQLLTLVEEDLDPQVRIATARALARLQVRSAVEVLAEVAFTDNDIDVRAAAATALRDLPSVWTRDALVVLSRDTNHPQIQRAALRPTELGGSR